MRAEEQQVKALLQQLLLMFIPEGKTKSDSSSSLLSPKLFAHIVALQT